MKKTNIVLLVVIAVAIGIIVTMVGDFSTYETFATAREKEGKEYHIIGTLDKSKGLSYDPLKDANYFTFYMKDKVGETRKVIFLGTKPTDFEKAEQLVLTGKIEKGEFHCNKILMKCPSKYKDDQVAMGTKQM
ncbi:MAG TPA: cytochrome c maturation protein CcmE [Chitinophaga sp.]|jgi:cytochrome c-type biogenesis protein CcmE|uniref:cytochrome c maturation protein CcmE domain-containing protein n=1 Tax=Chitinophaga sp. TaxID=1869181 RepID=UPI002DBB1173|nr:cytochrome c maturation protein CcmE [Chitinophaga sp.]HEU4556006.1 cytochrome c maturation protein CcmE [Chitinophaga sp.]